MTLWDGRKKLTSTKLEKLFKIPWITFFIISICQIRSSTVLLVPSLKDYFKTTLWSVHLNVQPVFFSAPCPLR